MPKFNINDLLNGQSKNNHEESPVEAYKHIPIEKLVSSSANLYGIREIEALAANIESMGLMHNLLVRQLDNGQYEIISGERRYRACKLLYDSGNTAFATVLCKVETETSDTLAELKLIFANATARELTDYEKAEQARRLKELFRQLRKDGYAFKGRLREVVAEALDMSPAQVGRLESVSEKLIPEYKEELKAGNIGITDAYNASTLPQETQRETLKEYRQQGAGAIKQATKNPPRAAAPEPPPTKKPEPPKKEQTETQTSKDYTMEIKRAAAVLDDLITSLGKMFTETAEQMRVAYGIVIKSLKVYAQEESRNDTNEEITGP